MFKPNFGCCSHCKKNALIVVKKGYCQRCNKELKDSKKKAEGKYKAPKQYVKKKTGELAVFLEIYNEREPYCEWCGTPIIEFSVANYHHVVEKSKSLELRLDKKNIVKICFDCHFNVHNK